MQSELGMFLPMTAVVADRDGAQSSGPMKLQKNDRLRLEATSTQLSGLIEQTASKIVSVQSHPMTCSDFLWREGLVVTTGEAQTDEGEIAGTF